MAMANHDAIERMIAREAPVVAAPDGEEGDGRRPARHRYAELQAMASDAARVAVHRHDLPQLSLAGPSARSRMRWMASARSVRA